MRKYALASSLLILCLLAGPALACGPDITFRSYLTKRFWQPFAKYNDAVITARKSRGETCKAMAGKEKARYVYAGFSGEPASGPLTRVRSAFSDASYEEARQELSALDWAGLPEKELEELRLIDAKVDMKMAEEAGDPGLAAQARDKFKAFLLSAGDPGRRSEARGWLARTHYLLDEYPSAAKIYLDEVNREDTVFTRQSLDASLHMMFPYNGSSSRLSEHLEEYFDTPAHALFVVYIVTNPVYSRDERVAMAKVGRAVVESLLKHEEIFDGTDLSDALVLALMRAAIYMGDPKSALTYSKRAAPGSPLTASPEYNWMTGACLFLEKDYAGAEGPLLKIVNSKDRSPREYLGAVRGLVGIYQKLGRPVDQLHAAFLYERVKIDGNTEPAGLYPFTGSLTEWEWLLDTPYLLDVQLTDDELSEYLVRYGKEARQIPYPPFGRIIRTAYEGVEYALAVRAARKEHFKEAAAIYERLHARPRAERMKLLADLCKAAFDPTLPVKEQWEAKYRYASFLEAHSTGIFFNDMIWYGSQTWTFFGGPQGVDLQGLTSVERNRFKKEERRVKDEQEERWRAYGILASVVKDAGYSDLGKQAAIKAIRCLDLIVTRRFGRADEIDQARQDLLKWLGDYKKWEKENGKAAKG